MLRNYLTISLRTIRKQRLYSFINVVGLSVGLASFFLIGLFVQLERSFDQFHLNKDRIFKIAQVQPQNMYLGTNHFAVTPAPLPDAMMEEMPSVELATQINELEVLLTVDNTGFYEKGLWATEPFFHVFTFPLLTGDHSTVLRNPEDIVLSESLARKMFGTIDVVGRGVEASFYSHPKTLNVVGVMADVLANSSLQFDFVVSFLGSENRQAQTSWGNNSFHTYGLAREGTPKEQFDDELKVMTDAHTSQLPWIRENPEGQASFYSFRLTDIHLHARINFDISENGDIRYVWLFSAVAFLILLTACINYMNLATARAALRGREVGVRKVSGASRTQLIRQFMGEAVATALTAAVASIGLVLLTLPILNSLVDRDIGTAAIFDIGALSIVLITGLIVGLISGSYPALFLSKMQPATILKGSGHGSTRSFLRNALVVGQFSIGIVLVLGVIVIQQQMSFISDMDTGVERDHLLAIRVRDEAIRANPETILLQMENVSGVNSGSAANNLPIRISSNSVMDDWEGRSDEAKFFLWNGDIHFGWEDLVGVELVAGRAFSAERPADAETGILLNEAAIRALGWSAQEAIGRTLDFRGRTQVSGVLKDFHFQSLRETIAPLALRLNSGRSTYLLLKIQPTQTAATLAGIEEVWRPSHRNIHSTMSLWTMPTTSNTRLNSSWDRYCGCLRAWR